MITSIEDLLGEHSHIDVGKYSEKLTRHFLGDAKTKSIKINNKPIKFYTLNMKSYYANEEDGEANEVMSMVTNLDTGKKIDEVDDFLS